MAKVRFVQNPAGMAELRSWEGPIGRDLQRRAELVKRLGQLTAPVLTGELKAQIDIAHDVDVRGNLEALVGDNPKKGGLRGYSLPQHEGSRPHVIRPRKPGGALRFTIAGKVVYAKSVFHPGNRATHYLSKWLPEAVK